MYRIFGELADPPDGSGSIAAVRAAVWKLLRITPREITRRWRLTARPKPTVPAPEELLRGDTDPS